MMGRATGLVLVTWMLAGALTRLRFTLPKLIVVGDTL